jgi:hypothetical protein
MKSRVINDEMPYYDSEKRKLEGIMRIPETEKIVDIQELKDSIHYKKELY